MTNDELKLQEYEDRFRNAYKVSVDCQYPEIRMNFTIQELMEIGMYLMELKHIKEMKRNNDA